MRPLSFLFILTAFLLNAQTANAFKKIGKASADVPSYTNAVPDSGTVYVFTDGEKTWRAAYESIEDAKVTFDYTYENGEECKVTYHLPIGQFNKNNCGREEPYEYVVGKREFPTKIDSSFGKFKMRFHGKRSDGSYNTLKFSFKYKGTLRIRVPAGEFDVHRLDIQHQRLRLQYYYSPKIPGRPVARMRDGTIVLGELSEVIKPE